MCSIHLDDATAAILYQKAYHTPAYWWRGDSVMKPIIYIYTHTHTHTGMGT